MRATTPSSTPGRKDQDIEVLMGRRGPEAERAVRLKELRQVRDTAFGLANDIRQIQRENRPGDIRDRINAVHASIYNVQTYVAGFYQEYLDEVALVREERDALILETQELAQDALDDVRLALEQADLDLEGDIVANSSSISSLWVTASGLSSSIVSEQNARISADAALTTSINTVSATATSALNKANTNQAAITAEQTARANGDSAISATVTSLTATVNSNTTAITAEQVARANADTALSGSITTLTATVNANTSAITTEQAARTSADSALTTSITTLTARVTAAEDDIDDNAAAITAESTARADGDSAISLTVTSLTARVTAAEDDIDDTAAAITAEQIARANADSALSSTVTTLTATVNSNTTAANNNAAAITAEQTARANGDSALSSSLTTLTARVTTAENDINVAEAAITAEQAARVSGDGALAADVTTLETQMGAAQSSITTQATAIATLEGYAAATYTFRVKAGTSGAQIELVAADDPVSGPTSALRVTADNILLDGSVLAHHIDVEDLGADTAFIAELTATTAFINTVTVQAANVLGTMNANQINFNGSVLKNQGGQLTLTENGVTRALMADEAATKMEMSSSPGATHYDLATAQSVIGTLWSTPGNNADVMLYLYFKCFNDSTNNEDSATLRTRLRLDGSTKVESYSVHQGGALMENNETMQVLIWSMTENDNNGHYLTVEFQQTGSGTLKIQYPQAVFFSRAK